jgi:hypothetical protein
LSLRVAHQDRNHCQVAQLMSKRNAGKRGESKSAIGTICWKDLNTAQNLIDNFTVCLSCCFNTGA